MASQVLSGSGNVSYTNNTGQNVRVIINYLACPSIVNVSWAGVTISSEIATGVNAGRNAAFGLATGSTATVVANNSKPGGSGTFLPTEIMLAAGQTFAISSANLSNPITAYNIVVIPEAG
jgi:hypothetical protein